jgi:hypothetical protein
MKRHLNLFAILMLAIWIASFVASAKFGHPHADFGLFNGG